MGCMRTIGVPLVSPASEHASSRVSLANEGVVGAFVAALFGGLLWGCGAFALRVGFQWIQAKRRGHRFDAFDRPPPPQPPPYSGARSFEEEHEERDEPEERVAPISLSPQKGRFF